MLLRAAAFGARILIIGFAGGKIHDWPANRILLKCASLIGVRAGEWSRHFTDVKSDETALLLKLAGEGALRPYVSQLFPLNTPRTRYERLQTAKPSVAWWSFLKRLPGGASQCLLRRKIMKIEELFCVRDKICSSPAAAVGSVDDRTGIFGKRGKGVHFRS